MSIKKHTAYNLLGAMLPMGLSLFTIPLYISLIGEARYGVLAVAWLLLGYFGLFDLGLGRATAQRIAALGDASSEQLSTTFWTALGMNVSLGVIGGLVIWPVAVYFFERFFSVDIALRPELAAAIPWLVLAVPLATLSGVLTGALEGRAKFLELNFISVASAVLIQLMPLAVVWVHGPDLAWLLPTVVLTRLVSLSLLFFLCRVHVFHKHIPMFSRQQAKGLLQFGGWVTVSSLVSPMMVMLDRFVIGSALGAKAVTYYTVPFQLAERSILLSSALNSALFPRLAAATSDKAKELATTAISALAVVMTPLIIFCVLLIEPFLRWWLNPEFASRAGLTAQILLLGFWINSFARVPYALLQAAGRPAVIAKCHLVEFIPYLMLLYIGLHFWGLPGAAMAFSLRTLTDCVLLMWLTGTLGSAVAVITLPALLLLAGLTIAATVAAGSVIWYVAAFGLLLFSLMWSWRTAPPEVRNLIFRIVNKTPHQKQENLL
jgi:O-antigen/teichoic acid export membrane protein